jgi:predicted nucleic acid-binding protein
MIKNNRKVLAVCDTCVIVSLYKSGYLFVLDKIFEKIIITYDVKAELEKWLSIDEILSELKSYTFSDFGTTINPGSIKLNRGEISAISYAVNNNRDIILTDDLQAIKESEKFNLTPLRALDILKIAKLRGYIPSVLTAIQAMEQAGEGVNQEFKIATLQDVGEL